MNITSNFILLIFMLVPVFLITGPALPDIAITFSVIFFLYNFIVIKKDYVFFTDRFFQITIIFWTSIIFISFFAYDKSNSIQDSLIFIRILSIPTIAYFFFLNDEKKLKTIISIIFFCVVFVLIDTLFQYLNYTSEFGFGRDLLGFKSEWYGRLTGPFKNELIPGAYLAKFSLLGYLFFFFYQNIKYKNFYEIFYLGLVGLVCFASGERMSLATFFLAMLFLLIFLKSKRLIIILAIFFSVSLIIISIKFHPFYNDYEILSSTHYHQGLVVEKYYECNNNNEGKCTKIIELQPNFIKVIKNFNSSAYGEIYHVALKMFMDNPITGIGISNYEDLCLSENKYRNIMKNYNCASHPHNLYLQWLSEGGLITFLLFMLLIINIIYLLVKTNNSEVIKYISIASIIILFWPIMSTGSLIKNWNGITTFYIVGLCISLCRVKIN